MGEQIVTNEQEAAMLGVHTHEWVGRICGIVTPLENSLDEYPEGFEEPCVECDSPVHAACVAVVRKKTDHRSVTLDELRAIAARDGHPGPDVEEHEEGYDGPCFCQLCLSYA